PAPPSEPPRRAARPSGGSQPTLDFDDGEGPGAEVQPVGPGVLVAGRYRVEKMLGQGGMGAVYRAFDLELSEPVALKVLTGASHSEASLARFRQELKLSRRLSHRNIVRVHDIGLHAGQYFISMELLQGADLRRHLEARALPRGIGIDLMVQATEGLQAAHDLGVVHRDIKPENLFVTLETVVKVMDFGIARAVQAPGMTMAGVMGGTACYMSPEQASDFSSANPASDQYSLAVVVYELLVGRPPFEHPALLPLLHMHATEPPPPLRDEDPSIPEAVEAAVLRALAKLPCERFESCAAFGEALRAGWEDSTPRRR
ncbi:MAG: serine/threonine protein kinase, partial [Proteobacteria bacterium]|nr:serine/threonine protein kinase [Pseudomonadota bacterium]